MAKVELRKAIDSLLKEKQSIDAQLTSINDGFTLSQEQLMNYRREQASYREARATLSNTNQSNPAKKVLNQQISEAQLKVDEILKSIDKLEKDRVVWAAKGKAIDKSIKELQNA